MGSVEQRALPARLCEWIQEHANSAEDANDTILFILQLIDVRVKAALREQPEARGVVDAIPEATVDAALRAWFDDPEGAGLDGGPEHREWRTRMSAALTAAQQQGQAVAWVPVHPRQGPLWAMATDKPDRERLPSYPLRPLIYGDTAAPPSAPVGVDRLDLIAADVQAMLDAAKNVAQAPRDMPTRRMEAAYLAVLDRIAGRRLAWESQREPGRWAIYSPDGSGYQLNDDESGEAAKWLRRVAESLGGDALFTQQPAQAAPGDASFQSRVSPWMIDCFGAEIADDQRERGDRLLEETLELLQSHGYDPARVATLTEYVYGRPVGEPEQEVGGVMVTLAAYCRAARIDMHEAGERELARILRPEIMEKIRRKQEGKRGLHTPLPTPPGDDAAGGGS